jgi:hypothetical protein
MTMTVALTITMPGAAWEEAFDPAASGMAADLGLPAPTFKRRGRGFSATYENVTPEQAREVARHLIDMGELFLSNSDPEYEARERGRYRTMIAAGEKILDQT